MAIKRPDIYEHNNPNNAISDSDFVRGGIRTKVPNLPALGALASKADQMKEYATFVWVESENKYYVLVDKNNIGNINGWSSTILGSNSGGDEGTLPSIMIFKDTVPTYDDLEAVTGQEQGWVYGVIDTGKLYVWIEDYGGIVGNNIWKDMGVAIDFSNYYTKTQSDNRYINKQGINLGDTGNIPEMKVGDISGIYRGNPASNPVYEYSPFLQMSTVDTFGQIHLKFQDGEMSYRAGNVGDGYSPLRVSWDSANLVNPATQGWVTSLGYVLGDTATNVGFISGNKDYPYLRHNDTSIIELATKTWVNSQKGIANGFAPLNSNSLIDSAYLPSYVDDVLEVTNYGALPATGETGKIYVILNASGGYQANQQFRWSGGGYIALVSSPGTTDNVPEGTNNKYYTDARVGTYVATLGYATTSSVTSGLAAKMDKNATIKTISGNVTLDSTYNGAYCRITANCTITVPTGLGDFECYFYVVGNFTATFNASAVTANAPFGSVLKNNLKCYLKSVGTNSFDLIGDLLTS